MPDVLCSRPCSAIEPAAIRWLWKPFLARGKVAVLDGDPGVGKSFLAVDLAARLSRGGPLPDGQALDKPLVTLLVNPEDDPFDTVCPRACWAGADRARVFVAPKPGAPVPQFPDGAKDLEALVYENAADLVVLDPLSAFLPRSACGSDSRVRHALAPLAAMAAETGCAVLLVRHRGQSAGPNAVYRGPGSVGVLGVARTGMLLARHPDDPDLRVLAMTKSNLAPPATSLGFRLTSSESGTAVQWTGPIDLSADELCGSQAAQIARRPRERAMEFLRAALATGPRPVTELEKLAGEKGLSWNTVLRAKAGLKIVSNQKREGDQTVWYWTVPGARARESNPADVPLSSLALVMRAATERRRKRTPLLGRDHEPDKCETE